MNALISLDSILEPTAALTPATLFGSGQVETILAAIENDVRSEVFDIATQEGRDRIKSVAYKIARSKTTLDEIGKEHVAEIKAKSAAIDKERKTLRDRLDALKDEVRGPLTKWEEDEANRISGHEAALVIIVQAPTLAAGKTSEQISAIKAQLEEMASRDWQEFGDRAISAFAETMPKICELRDTAAQRERDQAELEALRKEKAERDARDRAEAEAKAKAEAAAALAERERQDREEQAKRLEAWKLEQAELAKKQTEEAAARAVEAERVRVAREKAEQELAERKRAENKRRREKVHAEITLALSEVLTGNADEAAALIAAIAAGRIPHVSITY
jgi:hypothetical protein